MQGERRAAWRGCRGSLPGPSPALPAAPAAPCAVAGPGRLLLSLRPLPPPLGGDEVWLRPWRENCTFSRKCFAKRIPYRPPPQSMTRTCPKLLGCFGKRAPCPALPAPWVVRVDQGDGPTEAAHTSGGSGAGWASPRPSDPERGQHELCRSPDRSPVSGSPQLWSGDRSRLGDAHPVIRSAEPTGWMLTST